MRAGAAAAPADGTERVALQNQADALQQQLDAIKVRLDALAGNNENTGS